MRKLIVVIAAAILCSAAAVKIGPVIIQRMDWSMIESRRPGPGEMVYIRNPDGTVTLRVGDGETRFGMQPIDPAGVRVAAQRPLDRYLGYYVETFGGATANPDGTYTIGAAAIAATGGVRVVSQDARFALSRVDFDLVQIGWSAENFPNTSARIEPSDLVESSTNTVTIYAEGGGGQYVVISNLSVCAWVDRLPIGTTNDHTQTTMYVAPATDRRNPVTLGQITDWLADNEGRHWSLHGAVADVLLAGYGIAFDAVRSWAATSDGTGISFGKWGYPSLRVFAGSNTNGAGAVSIAYSSVTTNVMDIYVATADVPVRAPGVGATTSLARGLWRPWPQLYNSWPDTVEVISGDVTNDCYLVQVAAPAGSMFFRVSADLPGGTPPGIDVGTLMIGGKRLVCGDGGVVTWE